MKTWMLCGSVSQVTSPVSHEQSSGSFQVRWKKGAQGPQPRRYIEYSEFEHQVLRILYEVNEVVKLREETVRESKELMPEQPEGFGLIKNIVCAYCRNKFRHGCITECAREGLYRNLEPMELDAGQYSPKLPSMAKLMEYAPVTRLALMYLVLHYMLPVGG